MDAQGSYQDTAFHPLAEPYSMSPEPEMESANIISSMEQPGERQRVNTNSEALVTGLSGSGSSLASDILEALPRRQELWSLSSTHSYPHESYPEGLCLSSRPETPVHVDHKMAESIVPFENMQGFSIAFPPVMEHQAAIEDDYTLHCPLRLPLIQHGETQFVPLQADGVPGYAAEPYNDGAFFGNMKSPAIVGEMDTYISPYAANICDTIVGHMTGENPKTLMASPETMIHDTVVDPLLETNGVDLAPRQVPPTPPPFAIACPTGPILT